MENQSKRNIMRQIRDRWNDHVPTSWLWRHLRSLLWRPMTHMGTLSTAHVDNFELSQGPQEVVLRSRQLAQDLSALLAGHDDISAVDNFATEYPHVITGAAFGNVVVVSYEIKRKAMSYLLVIGLMASALVGLALGISRASIEVGFTVFGGMTILVTAPMGVVFWMKP
ncbi:hypothetical protein FALBO_6678 [Fusarium albosuccineum]|uniref:Uncharacterized protein n=1 Tax=Fusarium albosuccineum TaxID=1237068 RepID=A0A8H4LFB2_9HYPO|nr:hypothetical protein FALBO_6678 [Fusarium albosuccineum]